MNSNPILDKLNDKQIEAVKQTDGPVLILAGAGSGKTRTLVHRIAYLIREKKVPPAGILAVTFTNKAALEMKERTQKLLNAVFSRTNSLDANQPWVGTFHSFCVRVLRKEIGVLGYKNSFLIYDDYDRQVLIKDLMRELNLDPKQFSPKLFLNIISDAKNKLETSEEYCRKAHEFLEKNACLIYEKYQTAMKSANALDFDDLIMQTVILFLKYPPVLKKYQCRFQYLMVDEYQDTNHAQYLLTKLLANLHKNICVVGDDWQGIYSFRGANVRNILEFEKDYPNAAVIYLEQNYRSTKTIVEAGNKVIAQNKSRTDKKLWTESEEGEKIEIRQARDEKDEGEFIVESIFGLERECSLDDEQDELSYEPEENTGILDRIMELRKIGGRGENYAETRQKRLAIRKMVAGRQVDLSRFVVLYRTNAQSRALEETFLSHGIPYQIIGGLKFYERKEIKDVLAYLRILVNAKDKVALKRIINEPPRGIGQKTWYTLEENAALRDYDYIKAASFAESIPSLSERARSALKIFATLINGIKIKSKELMPGEIIDLVIAGTGYKKSIDDRTEEGKSRLENIQELKTVAKKYGNLKGMDGLNMLLEEIALVSDIDSLNSKEGITLMTAHNAKGLEFDTVFLAGMEEGLFPHANSIYEPSELEEERRLCYVAITRARKKVFLVYTRQRNIWGTTRVSMPSRFIGEIPDKLVTHKKSPYLFL